MTYRESKKLSNDASQKTVEWPALKEENLSTQNPTPSENIFENEGEIKSLEEKEKLREYIARRPLFQLEISTEVL